jgi:hypothetical protein
MYLPYIMLCKIAQSIKAVKKYGYWIIKYHFEKRNQNKFDM